MLTWHDSNLTINPAASSSVYLAAGRIIHETPGYHPGTFECFSFIRAPGSIPGSPSHAG
ncbi:MAG TPA: hypothetical protein VJZ27_01445 [Aggregatilineales bacterium]|nr:hypothetical protein [Aggregatilineales bacterium]